MKQMKNKKSLSKLIKQDDFVLLIKNGKKTFCKVFKIYQKCILLVDKQNMLYTIKKEKHVFVENDICIFIKQKIQIVILQNVLEITKKNFEKVSTSININILVDKYLNKTINNYDFYLLCKHYKIKLKGSVMKWLLTSTLIINKNYTFCNRYKSNKFEKYKNKLNEVVDCS